MKKHLKRASALLLTFVMTMVLFPSTVAHAASSRETLTRYSENETIQPEALSTQTRTRTFNSTGPSMGQMHVLNGLVGTNVFSNQLVFNTTAIPAHATIENISVRIGTRSNAGTILVDNLWIESSGAGGFAAIPWNGAANSTVVGDAWLRGTPASGLFGVDFSGFVLSGQIVSGIPTNTAVWGYRNVQLVITYRF